MKLKTECGYQFTSKLEGMITDMKTSRDTMQGFNALLAGSNEVSKEPTLAVQVLTTCSCPTSALEVEIRCRNGRTAIHVIIDSCECPNAQQLSLHPRSKRKM